MPTPEELAKQNAEEQQRAAATAPISEPALESATVAEPVTPKEPAGIVASAVREPYVAPVTEPVTTEVDPEQETVEGRLAALTSGESRYVTQARETAERRTGRRGLISSTIAAGAGEEAAISAALPIAQQDAETYAKTRFMNQEQRNQFLQNRQSMELNKEVAAAQSGLTREEAAQASELSMQRDAHSADLNAGLANLDASLAMMKEAESTRLRTEMESILSNEKFSDQVKIDATAAITKITLATQQQITDIGLSDRSAEAQAAAIKMAEANRDASIQVYQDLLNSFEDWNWSTDFTPTVPVVPVDEGGGTSAPSSGDPIQDRLQADNPGATITSGPSGYTVTTSGSSMSYDQSGRWISD